MGVDVAKIPLLGKRGLTSPPMLPTINPSMSPPKVSPETNEYIGLLSELGEGWLLTGL